MGNESSATLLRTRRQDPRRRRCKRSRQTVGRTEDPRAPARPIEQRARRGIPLAGSNVPQVQRVARGRDEQGENDIDAHTEARGRTEGQEYELQSIEDRRVLPHQRLRGPPKTQKRSEAIATAEAINTAPTDLTCRESEMPTHVARNILEKLPTESAIRTKSHNRCATHWDQRGNNREAASDRRRADGQELRRKVTSGRRDNHHGAGGTGR
jgi:hypothetical protein